MEEINRERERERENKSMGIGLTNRGKDTLFGVYNILDEPKLERERESRK